jgi:pimeloyl-ACP methyl ester carboxylesterase
LKPLERLTIRGDGLAVAEADERGYRAVTLDLRGHGESDIRRVIEAIGGEPVVVGASLGGLVGMMIAASAPQGFASLEEAAEAVSAYLPHRPRPKDTSGLQRNLRLRHGRYFWHWDPAFGAMGRRAGANAKFDAPNPLMDVARALTIPTLLVRGARSSIVSEAGAREFLELVPHAEFVDIAGAHHMVAGDANDAFNDAVFGLVARQSGMPAGS